MFPAVGMDFILNGATEDDVQLVQSILDGYKGKPYFDPDMGNEGGGKAVSSETFELPDRYCTGLDLSEKGIIKVKDDSRIGIINYDEADRKPLLEQLVLMFSGYRIADVDVADFLPVFEKKCSFRWIEYKEGELSEKATKLLKVATKGRNKQDVDLFNQFTDGNIPEIYSLKLDDEYHNVISQIITTEQEGAKGIFAVFITGIME